MIYINFNHLNEDAQDWLLGIAREHIEESEGETIKEYCITNGIDYEKLIGEECIKKLYSYDYVFNV